jgi:hypothetical protein
MLFGMPRASAWCLVVCVCLGPSLFGETPAAKGFTKTVAVDASGAWVDTGLDAGAGSRLRVTATGTIQYPQAQPASADGLPRGWKDLLRVLPDNSSGRGALLGRLGSADYSQPFLIGASREINAASGGRLFLGVNQPAGEKGEGSFTVKIEVLDAGKPTADAIAFDKLPVEKSFSGIDAAALGKIPPRVGDIDGNPGDMVNFLILGSEDAMLKAFGAAGWVKVDRSRNDAIIHGLIATLTKESYVELPMSELYLFGRPQDYGLAHAEPFAVVAQRHHLRVWKAPFEVDGQTLWVGAATHDIGFDKDNRNGGVTHKIDPDVDLERKFVGESLYATGLVSRAAFLQPPNPLREARTATGGSFHSDGRVLALLLAAH